MQLLAELNREHRQLEERAAQLLRIVAAEVPDAAAVAAIRWEMAQALLDHCAREDRTVYDRLLASGDATATAVAWHYKQAHGTLGAAFGRYIADWPVDRISSDWDGFRAESETILELLARRIAEEEAVLYVHASRLMERRAA